MQYATFVSKDYDVAYSTTTVPYPADTRAQTRFVARIEPARDRPLRPARATFSTQLSLYHSAGYGMLSPFQMIMLPHKGLYIGDRIATWMLYVSSVQIFVCEVA